MATAPVFKLGLIGGGLVVAAVGTYVVICRPGWVDRTPWVSLSKQEYAGKWGGKYAKFLLSGKSPKNEKFWEQQYLKFIAGRGDTTSTSSSATTGTQAGKTVSSTPNTKFSNVKVPFGNNNEALSFVCNQAYEADPSKITPAGDGQDEFKEWEVWAYCSTIGGRITTLRENTSEGSKFKGENNYGKKYSSILAAADKGMSSGFWKAQQDELMNTYKWSTWENNKFRMLSEKLNFHPDNDAEEIRERSNLVTETDLRELCTSAYGADISKEGFYPQEEVFKFCSLEGEVPNELKADNI